MSMTYVRRHLWHERCNRAWPPTTTTQHSSLNAELERIVAALRAHFDAHPNAADTVDGIASWWLTGSQLSVSKAVVEQALQLLVDEGFVATRRTANGTVIYVLNKNQ